jgi:hypothetical protein
LHLGLIYSIQDQKAEIKQSKKEVNFVEVVSKDMRRFFFVVKDQDFCAALIIRDKLKCYTFYESLARNSFEDFFFDSFPSKYKNALFGQMKDNISNKTDAE